MSCLTLTFSNLCISHLLTLYFFKFIICNLAKLQIKIPLIFIYNKDDAVRGGKMIEKERELERKNEREREREREKERG